MDDLEKKSDEELWEIVKRGDNLHIDVSEASKAKRILDYRKSKQSDQTVNNFNGTFSFQGGNNILGSDGKIENTITIGQFLESFAKEIEEKAPETPEKKGLLESIKKFTINQDTGEFLGSFFGSLFKSSVGNK